MRGWAAEPLAERAGRARSEAARAPELVAPRCAGCCTERDEKKASGRCGAPTDRVQAAQPRLQSNTHPEAGAAAHGDDPLGSSSVLRASCAAGAQGSTSAQARRARCARRNSNLADKTVGAGRSGGLCRSGRCSARALRVLSSVPQPPPPAPTSAPPPRQPARVRVVIGGDVVAEACGASRADARCCVAAARSGAKLPHFEHLGLRCRSRQLLHHSRVGLIQLDSE